jgi:hypothetical protein
MSGLSGPAESSIGLFICYPGGFPRTSGIKHALRVLILVGKGQSAARHARLLLVPFLGCGLYPIRRSPSHLGYVQHEEQSRHRR